MKPVTMQKKSTSSKKAARTKKTANPNPCATATSSSVPAVAVDKIETHTSKTSSQSNSNVVEKASPSQTSFPHISEKSVKCYWEQYNDSDIEIAPDVCSYVAESASFKLWELLNSLKTYTRHCGGKLTTELLDGALADSDAPPTIGANSDTGWEGMEADGLHFFNSDYVFHLHDEFMKPIEVGKTAPISLQVAVFSDKDSITDLERFCVYLCNSVFIGDQICFDAAISIAFSNPYIGCMLKPMLLKCIQMLAFDYKQITLQRILKLLSAVARNPSCRNIEALQQFHHLANLFECILLGPSFLPDATEHVQKTDVVDDACIINLTNELPNNFSNEPASCQSMNIEDMGQEYEPLYNIMSYDCMKKESNTIVEQNQNGTQGKRIKEEVFEDVHTESSGMEQQRTMGYNYECNGSVPSVNVTTKQEPDLQQQNDAITTIMCDESDVESVVQTMATIASVWGYFEDKLIENVTIRVEHFFQNVNDWNSKDYDYLKRLVQGILALGDFAFRELLEHLEVINIQKMTNSLQIEFNLAAIYIRGRSDIFIYEWLHEVCGDGLQPFMLYYASKIPYFDRYHYPKRKLAEKVKLKLKTLPLKTPLARLSMNECFPDLVLPKPPPKQIAFRFPGCRPAPARSRRREICREVQPTVQNLEYLSDFNSKIVVCKRRLMKRPKKRKEGDLISIEQTALNILSK